METFLDIPKSIKEKKLTLTEAAGLNSVSGIQGYQRCYFKSKCKNNKCLVVLQANFVNQNVMNIKHVKINS